ncbi:MAG: segregation/condensation protein A [Vulcanococcus sp.]
MTEAGARLAIRLLQDAAERGELDPWDVDVIAVVDGFLDQLRARIEVPRLVATASGAGQGGSYEQDLAETSEAFLAASVLVGLKAEVLEAQTFPPPPIEEDSLAFDVDADGQGWLLAPGVELPPRPESHLLRRPVAPPPLQRPVTLGELIRQLEEIAERLEQEEGQSRTRSRSRRFSDRAVIEQVAALAHREKLPETTAALSQFLLEWPVAVEWCCFEALVQAWAAVAPEDLDCDRVGVFWALLFLCSQGRVELDQQGGLHGPLQLKRRLEERESVQLPLPTELGSARGPAGRPLAA